MSRYPDTIHITADMARKIDQPVDAAVISSRPGGGNTTQSYVKGDIIADGLNEVFGPLGWGVEAKIHQIDDWDETKNVQRNNSRSDVNFHMVQVISDVKLTIKKTTPDGTDTVFVQPGIGYGEVEEGKARKEAFGMAVKGAATDGLKRCASLVGKKFGMMMASNGSQEDIEYAHNGRAQNLRRAQDMRRGSDRDQGGRGRDEGRGGGRQRDDGGRDQRSGGQRDEGPRDHGDARGGQGGARQERPQSDRQRDDRQQQGGRQQDERQPQGDRPQQDERQQSQGARRQDDRQQDERRPADPKPQQEETRREPQGKADQREPEGKGGDAGAKAPANGASRRQPDTTYVLDHPPITKDDMTDFGASLVARVGELRQDSDRTGLVRQHLHTIKNLDPKIRKRVIERLREHGVDVDAIAS